MLHFNTLRYSNNGKNIIIDVAVNDELYYKDVYIDSIIIDTQDTYIDNGPSSNAIFTYKVPEISKVYTEDIIPVKTEDKSQVYIKNGYTRKHVRLEIPVKSLGIYADKSMLFVYAVATGKAAIDTPCGMDNTITLGTIINIANIYNYLISYIREIEEDCSKPNNFIDLMLRYKALELSIKTGNYILAIKYWRRFFQNIKVINKSCKCYGYN